MHTQQLRPSSRAGRDSGGVWSAEGEAESRLLPPAKDTEVRLHASLQQWDADKSYAPAADEAITPQQQQQQGSTGWQARASQSVVIAMSAPASAVAAVKEVERVEELEAPLSAPGPLAAVHTRATVAAHQMVLEENEGAALALQQPPGWLRAWGTHCCRLWLQGGF